MKFRSLTLGEVLDGDRMAESLYEINFKGVPLNLKTVLVECVSLCGFMVLCAIDSDFAYLSAVCVCVLMYAC